MSRKKGLLLMVGFMIITITVINLIANKSITNSRKIEVEYFKNLDLKVTGVICGIEKQTDTYKFLITIKNIKSNYKEYSKPSTLGPYFCIIKNDIAIFADSNDGYKLGDSIYIGENNTDLIKCVSKMAILNLLKKERMLCFTA
ncbi:hypothetical protein H0I23_11075 [Cellulophaga sp. HaHaR_3_176]|uniref:hypothetical protein n=1 Tax=Cellulophaga sp. HaHaR_3_176 TaxID=1942464 RepID=UPI001C1F24AF|nr:hypothetical protein [Cellulophaga sp. HaHaR_3_176]QWX83002.1 hypothetical protein H0I23_11075 [Cellulophaga sp. HaHaR_3_176]